MKKLQNAKKTSMSLNPRLTKPKDVRFVLPAVSAVTQVPNSAPNAVLPYNLNINMVNIKTAVQG